MYIIEWQDNFLVVRDANNVDIFRGTKEETTFEVYPNENILLIKDEETSSIATTLPPKRLFAYSELTGVFFTSFLELVDALSMALQSTSENTWWNYIGRVVYNGLSTNISSGEVLEAEYNGDVIYRYIANTLDVNGYPEEDAFYTSFDGTILVGLIATRHI